MQATTNQIKSLGNSLGMNIYNFCQYADGFSFTVKTELDAYKAAHKYQLLRTVVKYAPNISEWLVQVYKK